MTSRRALAVAAAVLALTGLFVRTDHGQAAPFVTGVNPRPRLMFAPGEYQRFVEETSGVRRVSFERLASEIDTRGTRTWNERDIQLESQALAARVLLDRGDARGERYLGYARRSVARLLETHTFTNWRDSHDIVTEGGRWIEAMAFAHDWLHDRWTPDERERMSAWLDEEVDDWVGGNRLARASASPFRNDAARGTAALVLAGLTLFDEPGARGGRPARARPRPAVLRGDDCRPRLRGRGRRHGRGHVLRQLHRVGADARGRGALHRRRHPGRVHPDAVLPRAAPVRHLRGVAGIPDQPVRIQRPPARPGVRRRAARPDRLGALSPRDGAAARQAIPGIARPPAPRTGR